MAARALAWAAMDTFTLDLRTRPERKTLTGCG
jgi:hypothetical protein